MNVSRLAVVGMCGAKRPAARVSGAPVAVDSTAGLAAVPVAAGEGVLVGDSRDSVKVAGGMGVNVLIVGVADGAGLTVEVAGEIGKVVRVAMGAGAAVGCSTLG